MSLTPLVRNYNMADGDLIQRSDAAVGSIQRDAADFSTRGVDAPRIAQFKTVRNKFSDFPTDEELAGILNNSVAAKDTGRRALEVSIRRIRNMAAIQYKETGLYKSFGFDDLTRQTDNDLFRTGRRVERVATTLMDDLAAQGLNRAIIGEVHDLTIRFDDAIDAMGVAVETRDIQTQQRIQLGNALFAQLSELASIGKNLYEDNDEARYNDYVIYDQEAPETPPAVPPAS